MKYLGANYDVPNNKHYFITVTLSQNVHTILIPTYELKIVFKNKPTRKELPIRKLTLPIKKNQQKKKRKKVK